MASTRKPAAAPAAAKQPLPPALIALASDGRLHPPAGVKATNVGHTGHSHGEPTDCAACAPALISEGWATLVQHAHRRELDIEERLKKAERARILGLDLPL